MENPNKDDHNTQTNRGFLRGPNMLLLLLAIAAVMFTMFMMSGPKRSTISYKFFRDQIVNPPTQADGSPKLGEDDLPLKSNIKSVELGEEFAEGEFHVAPAIKDENPNSDEDGELEKFFRVTLSRSGEERAVLRELLDDPANDVTYKYKERDNTTAILVMILFTLPLVFLLMMWLSYRRSRNEMMGGGFLSGFSKSPAKRYEPTKLRTTFKDVAGLKSVKADLLEIVEFLKSPEKFRKLGGRIPKGVLLNGPPGTGKTLLARAVAGEADVPFFSVSGSEFIQMFVGVGASRVRDLFKNAKDAGSAIIFIHEIDAVGRQRGAGLGGGHDEREQTLNQILSEMDGFTPSDSVIVVAATNRPDVLDPALLRPGRFDRHVTVGRPTLEGRKEIFKVHVRDVPLDADVNLDTLAAATVGLTGADIRNLVNEAALWAARQNKSRVNMADFDYSRDKVLMGAKREEVLSEKQKEAVAYHEAGHALLGWLLPGAHQVHKVTIVPRGRALGVTQYLPNEDQLLSRSEDELSDELAIFLGGRAAEHLVFEHINVGAENDLERATALARRMVTHWGMTERLGPVSYKSSDDDPFLGREIHQGRQFSEHTMELIDEEVARILHEADDRAISLLKEHREKLDKIAYMLYEKEEIDSVMIAAAIGASAQELAEQNGRKNPVVFEKIDRSVITAKTKEEGDSKPSENGSSENGEHDTDSKADSKLPADK